MKATGIVRRLDNLGRIIIPRELLRELKISEGTPMEIYINNSEEIILKVYHSMEDIEREGA